MSADRGWHSATLLPNGKVLIAGGSTTSSGTTALAELYDPMTDSFTATGSMRTARQGHSATLLANGKVLLAGGQIAGDQLGRGDNTASAELYDPATGKFTPTGSMAQPRFGQSAILLANGKVLITGGISADLPVDHTSAELYDPDSGTFKPTGPMTGPRTEHTATLLPNGKVLLTGGRADPFNPPTSAELYDPGTGSFSLTGSPAGPRYGHTATLLPNGKVLVIGGSTLSSQYEYVAAAELYDPATGSFSGAGSMPYTRFEHTATLLATGKVLIAGGVEAPFDYVQAPPKLYDPATGSFSPTGSMKIVRYGYSATLMPNGQVLIAGGDNDSVASAEIYTP
jgi:hypothetical protein